MSKYLVLPLEYAARIVAFCERVEAHAPSMRLTRSDLDKLKVVRIACLNQLVNAWETRRETSDGPQPGHRIKTEALHVTLWRVEPEIDGK